MKMPVAITMNAIAPRARPPRNMSVKGTLVRCSSGGSVPSFARRGARPAGRPVWKGPWGAWRPGGRRPPPPPPWRPPPFRRPGQPNNPRHGHRDAHRAEDHETDPPPQVVAQGGQGEVQHSLGE